MNVKVIISAAKRERSHRENEVAHKQLEYILRNYGYTSVVPTLGRFNGENEEGFLVDLGELKTVVPISDLCAIAGMFQQDCILIDRDGIGTLKSIGRPELSEHCIGIKRSFTRAPLSGDWTFVNGEYIQYK